MNNLRDTFELRNGVKIPCVGFGTWQAPDDADTVFAVEAAIRNGYRHIDTATMYHNEKSVGMGIKNSGVSRDDIFIATKLQNRDHGYEETLAAARRSIEELDCGYIDLYLIHWPNPQMFRHEWESRNAGSWKAMEELYDEGKIRALGLRNFFRRHIDALLKTARILPHVNQLRLLPGEIQEDNVAYSRELGMIIEAYSPLGTGGLLGVEEIKRLAEKYGKTAAQVCMRYSLEQGYLPLVKSMKENRIIENAQIFDFKLDAADVALMAGLPDCGITKNPDTTTF